MLFAKPFKTIYTGKQSKLNIVNNVHTLASFSIVTTLICSVIVTRYGLEVEVVRVNDNAFVYNINEV